MVEILNKILFSPLFYKFKLLLNIKLYLVVKLYHFNKNKVKIFKVRCLLFILIQQKRINLLKKYDNNVYFFKKINEINKKQLKIF